MPKKQIAVGTLIIVALTGTTLFLRARVLAAPFEIPERAELAERLKAVTDAVFTVYATAWVVTDSAGASRTELRAESVRLRRSLGGLLPVPPASKGLLAILLYGKSGPDGHGTNSRIEQRGTPLREGERLWSAIKCRAGSTARLTIARL